MDHILTLCLGAISPYSVRKQSQGEMKENCCMKYLQKWQHSLNDSQFSKARKKMNSPWSLEVPLLVSVVL